MSSKRYRVLNVPKCPQCGEVNYLSFQSGSWDCGAWFFCDICDAAFFRRNKKKMSNMERDYHAFYRTVRVENDVLRRENRKHWRDLLPSQVLNSMLWYHALASRNSYLFSLKRFSHKRYQVIRDVKIIELASLDRCLDGLINRGLMSRHVVTKWKERILRKTDLEEV